MIRRLRRPLLFLAAALAASACNLLFSLDDYAAPRLDPCSTCSAARCQCVPTAPEGFDYARLRVPAAATDLCPSGTVAGVAMGQGARDTGCVCACDSPAAGAPCSLALFAGKDCQGGPVQNVPAGACTALTVTGDSSTALLPAASATCPALAKPRPADFAVRVLACLDASPGSGGCDDERTTCAAALDPPFDPAPCLVAKPGADGSCPQSYPHRYLFQTELDDQRTCDGSSCSCSPQQCPSTTATLCSDAACQASCGLSAENFSNCKNFNGYTHGRLDFDGKTQGECTPSGDAPSSGTVTASAPLTVCCRQTLPKPSPDAGG